MLRGFSYKNAYFSLQQHAKGNCVYSIYYKLNIKHNIGIEFINFYKQLP